MTPERWEQINAVLDAVLALPPDRRTAYLDAHHADDPALCARVRELAAACDSAGGFLEEPLADFAAPLMKDADTRVDAEHGVGERRVGPYRLLHRIARGGMGTVYLAVRDDEHFQKRVAVKLIRRGMDTDDVLRRFLHERQVLARLEHPHIARLLDGGLTADQRPYFVMEYVEGRPLDRYCDDHRLPVDERLRLFLDVCSAVRYAHQNLVVHRDLKPGNILVTQAPGSSPGKARVKLLDFGIAKVLSDEGEAGLTQTGMRVMTPEYAAPEQIRGEAVTTATDVYALGVLLYALLTGRLPYPVRGTAKHDVERAILDTEPTRPSTAITRLTPTDAQPDATPQAVSAARSTTLAALRRRLRGDLDTIVLKALKKEPARRYASVEALEEDLRRYLAGLPVRARRDTLSYRTAKFMRRHRLGVAVAALFLALLLSYAVTAQVQARRIAVERDKAQQVAAFLADLLKRADPFETAESLSVRDVLDRASARIDVDLGDQPELQAQLRTIMSGVYQNLGLYDAARPHAEQALALRQAVLGDRHVDVAASLNDLADVICFLGDYETSDSLYREALARQRAALGNEHEAVAETLTELGLLLYYKRERDESEAVLREALALQRTLYGERHPRVAEAMHTLAAVLFPSRDADEAEALVRQSLKLRRELLPPDHPDVVPSMTFLATILGMRGHLEEAETLAREALALYQRRLGPDHPYVARSLISLARILRDQTRFDEADSALQRALALQRRRFDEDHPEIRRTLREMEAVRQARADS